MKKVLLAVILFSSFLQTSCSEDLIGDSLTTINSVDVYVAGQKDNQACYWKNNQPVLLESSGIEAPTATKIIIDTGDVYVLGHGVGFTPLNTIPLFWKNGVLTNLKTSLSTDAEEVMSITDFEVVGDDVYFVGYTRKTIIDFEDYSLAYWKNGVMTVVHNYGGYAQNQARIAVVNNDVFVTGTNSDNGNITGQIDGYYKNGVFTEISNSILNGFAVNNNEIYVFGTVDNTNYYKNLITNSETTIPSASNGIAKILFDNNNMYLTDGGNIYKNGTLLDEDPMAISGIKDFKVLNDNVYKIKQVGFDSYISYLYINGVQTMELPDSEGTFLSIDVVQN